MEFAQNGRALKLSTSNGKKSYCEADVPDLMDAEIHSSKGTKMTDRMMLQPEFSELMNGLHASILKYATDRAEHHQCEFYLCVKNKSHSHQILKRIFDKKAPYKLKSNQVISVNGRKMILDSLLS